MEIRSEVFWELENNFIERKIKVKRFTKWWKRQSNCSTWDDSLMQYSKLIYLPWLTVVLSILVHVPRKISKVISWTSYLSAVWALFRSFLSQWHTVHAESSLIDPQCRYQMESEFKYLFTIPSCLWTLHENSFFFFFFLLPLHGKDPFIFPLFLLLYTSLYSWFLGIDITLAFSF